MVNSLLDPLFLIPFIPVLLLALTLHEFGHAWVADHFGDLTPRRAGRLTLNPLRHLDPLGTICLFIAYIGWAKPVPVNPANFRHPRADLWVSLAGITANLLQAVAYAVIWHVLRLWYPLVLFSDPGKPGLIRTFLILGMLINLSLALFNLLPLFPLDGSHVLKNLLPREQAYRFGLFSQRYGAAILMGLLFVGFVSDVSPLTVLIGVPRDWLFGLLLRGL
jgi:Zn-dependent protease